MVASATSASQSILSAAGCSHVSGLAILANPRAISRTIVIDVQLYLGSANQDSLIGSLRYFNSANLTFDDGNNLYFIQATFARRDSMADVRVSGNRALLDYTFIGDIHCLHLLGPLGPRYLVPEEFPNDSPEGNEGHIDLSDLPTFTIDPRVRPCIHVTGVAIVRSKAEETFEVNVEQYISCVKSDPSTGGSRLKPITRFLCRFPVTSKFSTWSSKPMPRSKCFVSVWGVLTGVDRSGDIEEFLIEIENITFCGQYVQPANAVACVSQSPPGTSTALYSYNKPPQSPPQLRKQRNQDGA